MEESNQIELEMLREFHRLWVQMHSTPRDQQMTLEHNATMLVEQHHVIEALKEMDSTVSDKIILAN